MEIQTKALRFCSNCRRGLSELTLLLALPWPPLPTFAAEAVSSSSAQCWDERRKLTLNFSSIGSDEPLQLSLP